MCGRKIMLQITIVCLYSTHVDIITGYVDTPVI